MIHNQNIFVPLRGRDWEFPSLVRKLFELNSFMSKILHMMSFVFMLLSSYGDPMSCSTCVTFVFVDCNFFACWSRWPFTVATDFGKCLFIKSCIIPGHDVKCFCVLVLEEEAYGCLMEESSKSRVTASTFTV